MILGYFALVAASFASAAFSVNFAEQPARLALDDNAALVQWPYTLLVIRPVNDRLDAIAIAEAGA